MTDPHQTGTATDPPRGERPIAGLPRNVFWLGLVSFFNDLGSEMIFPVLPMFLRLGLGASMAVVGLIDGIAEATSSLFKLVSGAWSDRLARRRPLVVAGYAISNAAQPLAGLATSWPAVLPLRFLDRLGKGVRTAPRDAIIADAARTGDRGRAYGFHRSMDSAGGVLGPILAFAIMAWLGVARGESLAQLLSGAKVLVSDYRWVILAAAVPNLVCVGLIFLVREKPREVAPTEGLSLVPPSGPFRMLLAAATVFALGNVSYSFVVLRAADTGIPATVLPLLYLFFHLAQMIFSGPLGAWSDSIGRRPVVAAGYASFAAMSVGWMYASRPWHSVALLGLYGFSLACTEGTMKAFAVDLVGPKARGAALGALNGAAGLAALPASLVAGVLWSTYGAPAAFAWAASLALAGALLLALVGSARPEGA